jgi:hypothetical protein
VPLSVKTVIGITILDIIRPMTGRPDGIIVDFKKEGVLKIAHRQFLVGKATHAGDGRCADWAGMGTAGDAQSFKKIRKANRRKILESIWNEKRPTEHRHPFQ